MLATLKQVPYKAIMKSIYCSCNSLVSWQYEAFVLSVDVIALVDSGGNGK